MRLQRVDRPDDPRLADYLGLTDPARRRAREGTEGIFIAEGALVVERVLRSRYPVRSVLLTERGLAALGATLETADVDVYLVTRDVARVTTGYDVHRGVLAAAGRLPLPSVETVLSAPTILVLEDLTDQVNLGALFRNAAALGAGGVLLSPSCCDPLYRRSVRVSMGAVLHVPFTYLPEWPDALADLAERGTTAVALTPDPAAETIASLAADPPARLALVLGSEGAGLSGGALEACARRVRIPMSPGADSLNVATAAAVALHRVNRSSGGP